MAVLEQQLDKENKPWFHAFRQLVEQSSVPHSVVGGCEVKEHCPGLELLLTAVLYVSCECGDLVSCAAATSEACLVSTEHSINRW